MKTLNVHSADALVTRWKTVAHNLDLQAEGYDQTTDSGWHMAKMLTEAGKVYRVCAAELAALTAASMELEAAHHGDPEPETRGRAICNADGQPWPCRASLTGHTSHYMTFVTETVSEDPNALLEWSQGRRP